MLSQLRLEVSSLIRVNNVALSQLVEQRVNAGQSSSSCSLVGHSTQITYGVASGLSIVMVVRLAGSRLADALQR